jgi:hypothetical protein
MPWGISGQTRSTPDPLWLKQIQDKKINGLILFGRNLVGTKHSTRSIKFIPKNMEKWRNTIEFHTGGQWPPLS